MIINTTYIIYVITTILLIMLVMSLQYGNFNNLMYSNNFQNTIIAYYGDTPPHGWVLCDGKIVNGIQTPDLRNKFVMGGDETSQTTLQTYLKKINFDKLSNENINTVNDIYDLNNYITDSTREIQGGENFAIKTSRIFNKEILKNNLTNIQNRLIFRNEDSENIDNIQSIISQITTTYNDIIDSSVDINNSHNFNSNIQSDDIDITSITDIDPIVKYISNVKPITDETLSIPADMDNTSKYTEITGITPDTSIDTTQTQTSIEKNNYKTWLNDKLGDNGFTDEEFDLLWNEFSNEGYDNNYIDSFDVSKFTRNLYDSTMIDNIMKSKLMAKLFLAYNPIIFTNITNRENVYTEYDNYKYPSSKQLTADNNLPPYYSLIYIMKL